MVDLLQQRTLLVYSETEKAPLRCQLRLLTLELSLPYQREIRIAIEKDFQLSEGIFINMNGYFTNLKGYLTI